MRIFYGHVCPIYQRDSPGMREPYTRCSVSDPLGWHFRRNSGLAGGCLAADVNISYNLCKTIDGMIHEIEIEREEEKEKERERQDCYYY